MVNVLWEWNYFFIEVGMGVGKSFGYFVFVIFVLIEFVMLIFDFVSFGDFLVSDELCKDIECVGGMSVGIKWIVILMYMISF